MSSVIEEYFRIMAGLSRENAERLDTVEWLLDDSDSARGSGRSLLMALAFIRKGAFEPGRWVKVWDHVDPSKAQYRRLMVDKIADMFPSVEVGTDAIQVMRGWSPKVFDKMYGFLYDRRKTKDEPKEVKVVTDLHYREVVKDVRMAATAAIMLGAPPNEVLDAVKEVIVLSVMET